MDHREGISKKDNLAMGGSQSAANDVACGGKALPSSPEPESCFECYACGKEFESDEELDLHARRCDQVQWDRWR